MGRLWPPKGHQIASRTSNVGFCCRLGGFVWRQWKVPTRKERLRPQGKRCAKWKENIVVVMFSFFLFLFLFCCRIEGSKEKTARAIRCAGRPCSTTPASLSATVQRRWLPIWIGRNCCSRYVERYRELIPNLCGNTLFNVGFLGFQHGVFGHP